MQWSLEKIYRERVRGNVPRRKHLRVMGEQALQGNESPDMEQLTFSFNGLEIDSEKDIDELDLDRNAEEYLKKALAHCRSIEDPDQAEDCWQRLAAKIKTHTIDDILRDYLVKRDWADVIAGKYANELVGLLTKDVSDIRGFSADDLEVYIRTEKGKPRFGDIGDGNFVEDLAEINVPSEFVERLMQHKSQDESIRGVGMGELAMTIFFNNIKAAKGKGDLSIDGEEFEIKGHGASLGATGDQRMDIKELIKGDVANGGLGIGYEEVISQPSKKNPKGKLLFTGPTYGGKIYKAANLAQAIEDAYIGAADKERFKDNLWNILKTNFSTGQKDEMGDEEAVKRVYDKIDLTSAADINSTVALMNFVRYISKEDVNHFMVHDFGSRGKKGKTTDDYAPSTPATRGDYIYVKGEPLDMAQQLSQLGAKVGFEPIQLNNLRPRIGLPMYGGGFYGAPTVPKGKY